MCEFDALPHRRFVNVRAYIGPVGVMNVCVCTGGNVSSKGFLPLYVAYIDMFVPFYLSAALSAFSRFN